MWWSSTGNHEDHPPGPLSLQSETRTKFVIEVAEGTAPSVVAFLKRSVAKCGLRLVENDTEALGVRDTSRFIVVRAPRWLIEQEAEHVRMLKVRRKDGKTEEFAAEEGSKYEGYERPGFWWPGEEAHLLWSLVEHIGTQDAEVAADFEKSCRSTLAAKPYAAEFAEELGKLSVLAALKVVGVIVDASPLQTAEAVAKIRFWLRLSAPADELAGYLGPNAAIYFVWMNSFSRWLLVPAVVGIMTFVRRQVVGISLDDDPFVPLYSLIVVFWSVAFVACWSREQARAGSRWGCLDDDQIPDEPPRPEFRGSIRVSPVTGLKERFSPAWQRYAAYVFSTLVTVVMLVVAAAWHVISLNLQGYVPSKTRMFVAPVAQFSTAGAVFDPSTADPVVGLVPTIVHVLMVQQLNGLYRTVAHALTDLENHPTDSDHDNALALKRFFFEAFDAYAALFYLAFVQFDLAKLRSELVAIYTVDSVRRVALETVVPLCVGALRTRQSHTATNKKSDEPIVVSRGRSLAYVYAADYDHFDDYLEMVLEFGYVTLFASAFPLASALSVVCNCIEIKNDVFKLLFVSRRPVPDRTANIGVWHRILTAIVWLGIVTNTALFATSRQLNACFPDLAKGFYGLANFAAVSTSPSARSFDNARFRALFIVVCLEHIIAFFASFIASVVPPKPQAVLDDLARRQYEKDIAAKKLRHDRLMRKVRANKPLWASSAS